ncbi:MAG TPA: bifunctional YncE family protein/alkaline phosphatase family protein, partial [Roseiarcus sp.]|nr:bifunctional YncE family protein/alkaline phosphatase family protein [Roseiarcus sp.]
MSRKRKDVVKTVRKSRNERLRPLATLLAMGLCAPALAGSSQFPTYQAGPRPNGSWVLGNGQVITPAGTQVYLGIKVRSKAIALNPNPNSQTAAVLTLGTGISTNPDTATAAAVEVFNTQTGVILQNYCVGGCNSKPTDPSGSYSGIAYSPDGKYLLFSQDSSNIAIAKVASNGALSDFAHISVPPNNSFIKCFPNSPPGSYDVPCGTFYSTGTSYPGGVAFAKDGKSAYALLNQNDTITKIDLTQSPPVQGAQIRVGNAPHSLVVTADGRYAYVSNEGGREATANDFQIYSAGTPIVADKVNGSSTTGTVSKVDLTNLTVVGTIDVGLHPTGEAFYGPYLLVANAYSDTISVIDTGLDKVVRTIDLGLPIAVPGQTSPAYGAAPNAIAVDPSRGVAYVALYNANAVAVVDLSGGNNKDPVLGLIPVGYAPSSVVLDAANRQLIVANDKGVGTRFSYETDYGVSGYNSHQDNGTVSIVPLPNNGILKKWTEQVYQNNHWDLKKNIESAGGGSPSTPPVAIPAKIGDPSLIKHVFLIIRENRTYDQVLGDVTAGNGDPSLAVFGANVTPNAHTLVKRFPLLDNFYTPSRQSADGHQWIVEAMAPYADDIQSPDWVRSYPGGNAGDALAYQKKGFLFQEAAQAGLGVKIYGEYVEYDTFNTPGGAEPSWCTFYQDAVKFETGGEPTLALQNVVLAHSSLPVVSDHLIKNFPQFDLGIPDQFRVDLWSQDFQNDVKAGTVPALSVLWIMDDHTGGPPVPTAEQADNDLAIGRIIDTISHSSVWGSSAIFLEEDDSQNGVDHVDGHRSPGYVVSPYVVQTNGAAVHTYYTQVNMTRAIEQILGLPPMNQFDLVATPMTDLFVKGQPPADNFQPWVHVPNNIPLTQGTTCVLPAVAATAAPAVAAAATPVSGTNSTAAAAWTKWKNTTFAGKAKTTPDIVNEDVLNHYDWYSANNFDPTKPYPGE